jgi:hypothetical protein
MPVLSLLVIIGRRIVPVGMWESRSDFQEWREAVGILFLDFHAFLRSHFQQAQPSSMPSFLRAAKLKRR